MIRMLPLRRHWRERHTRFRWRPSQGPPRCFLEQLAQHVWTHKLAWYGTCVGTATLLLILLPLLGVDVKLR